jgi:hypothetical protein
MAVTTKEEQVARLRKYLTPYIKGPNTTAVLEALAIGNAEHLVNNVAAVHDQLYVASASGQYLDELLAAYGITRPPNVGLSDDVFREIGIEVKNRKQVRDLINNILFHIFGDEYVKAVNSSKAFEPYNLKDGDTLIVNFDDAFTIPLTFRSSDFQNIAAASAQEVADAISKDLQILGYKGSAIAQNDGNGGYVSIISDTIGPQSSVTVLGGRAQNELLFDKPESAAGNATTQWTLSVQSGGIIRFTWTGGANPNVGKLDVGDYVNIFDGGFSSFPENEGSYTITNFNGGAAGIAYFEISNPFGSAHIITQGADDAVLFYKPIRKTIASRTAYAAVYQTDARTLNIFMPASTKVIRRDRIGSAHLHDDPRGVYTFTANAVSGDQFVITSTQTLVAGVDFTIGSDATETATNLADAINSTLSPLTAIAGQDEKYNTIVTIYQNVLPMTITITFSGSVGISASGILGDPVSLAPNQPGPYIYDLAQPFVVSDVSSKLGQEVDGTMSRVIPVNDSSKFPDQSGYLIFNYGWDNQEGPVPYIARPSNNTLLISPAYTIQKEHAKGEEVRLIAQRGAVNLSQDGLDYPFYITDTVSGRVYAEDLINSVVATGINVIITVLYPGDAGVGHGGTSTSEISAIWGA